MTDSNDQVHGTGKDVHYDVSANAEIAIHDGLGFGNPDRQQHCLANHLSAVKAPHLRPAECTAMMRPDSAPLATPPLPETAIVTQRDLGVDA